MTHPPFPSLYNWLREYIESQSFENPDALLYLIKQEYEYLDWEKEHFSCAAITKARLVKTLEDYR